jgi:hypothetical protein
VTDNLQGDHRHFLKFSWRKRPAPLSRPFRAIVFVFLSVAAIATHANGKPLPSCWVEFRFLPPIVDWGRLGLDFPLNQDFNRYVVVADPSAPDYRIGMINNKQLVYLFLASCEESKEVIAVLVGDSMKKKTPKIISMIVRPPKPSDFRLTKFYFERPKFWFKDCVVAVGMARKPGGKLNDQTEFLDMLSEFTVDRTDIFAPNESTADFSNARIIIAFWRACDRRSEMTRQLLSAYHQRHGNVGKYKILEKIDPPVLYESMSGSALWLDYYFPEGPPKK